MRAGRVYALVDVRSPYDYRYVGRTVDTLRRRLSRHKRTAGSMPHLHVARWITKAGPHNVRIVLLGEYAEDELNHRECEWMATLRAAGHELTNIAHGGSAAGFPRGYYRHSPETIARMVAARRANNSGTYGAVGGWERGKPKSPENRAAISEGLLRYHATKVVQQN